MAYISERREELLSAADELQKAQFGRQIRRLEKIYGNKENRSGTQKVFTELFSCWGGLKSPAASLGICYLFSSILTGSYEFKLVLLGKEFWLEEKPVEIMWRPAHFFECFEEDMKLVIKELKGRFPRLCSAEEEAVRFSCAEYYLAAVCALCRDITEEITGSREFAKMNKTEDFCLFFGRYQGEGEILWRISDTV